MDPASASMQRPSLTAAACHNGNEPVTALWAAKQQSAAWSLY